MLADDVIVDLVATKVTVPEVNGLPSGRITLPLTG